MQPPTPDGNAMLWLDLQALQGLIDALAAEHRVVGPRIADGTVVYDDLSTVAQLPAGWVDEQDGGSYRLHRDDGAGCFDHVAGPHSLKNFLFPARETLMHLVRSEDGWRTEIPPLPERPLAVIGVRACDLAALAIQDRVFLAGDYVDPGYRARRERLFVVAVNCRRAAATCFCHSMACGPAVAHGFDLALTETGARFALEVGSPRGADIAQSLAESYGLAACTPQEEETVRAVPRDLGRRMHARVATPGRPRPRRLATEGIRDLLFENLEHPRWHEVADRCLACGNCTLVCPTCFCASVADVGDLTGDDAVRERRWASCFSAEHSRLHDRTVRATVASRYRQWLTHKLAGWIDQFGTSGCTGCGRCITWCPVGIDLTEEVAAIRGEGVP